MKAGMAQDHSTRQGIYRHSRRSSWVQKEAATQPPIRKSSKWCEKAFFGDDTEDVLPPNEGERSGKQEARSTRDRLRPPNKALAGSALAARAGESDRAGTPVVRQPLTNENPTATSVRQGSAPYFFGTPRDAKDGVSKRLEGLQALSKAKRLPLHPSLLEHQALAEQQAATQYAICKKILREAGVKDVCELNPADEERWQRASSDADLAFARFEVEMDKASDHHDSERKQVVNCTSASSSRSRQASSENNNHELDSTAMHTPHAGNRGSIELATAETERSGTFSRSRKRPSPALSLSRSKPLPPLSLHEGSRQRSVLQPKRVPACWATGTDAHRRQHDEPWSDFCGEVSHDGMGAVGGGGPFSPKSYWNASELPFGINMDEAHRQPAASNREHFQGEVSMQHSAMRQNRCSFGAVEEETDLVLEMDQEAGALIDKVTKLQGTVADAVLDSMRLPEILLSQGSAAGGS